jgi:hypothetical protein
MAVQDRAIGGATRVGEQIEPARGWRGRARRLEPLGRLLSATIMIGAVCGAVIGGIGGRLAMRILFLTSPDYVKGLTSDDGFDVGSFDAGDTLGLVVFTAAAGVIFAVLFLLVLPFVRDLGRAVVPTMAALFGATGGAVVVHTGGVDFTVLEPVALAIVMFVALNAGFGAAVAYLVSRASADDGWASRRSWWLLGPPLAVLLYPPLLVVAAVAVAANLVADRLGARNPWWRGAREVASVVLVALFVAGAVDIARDTAALT